MSLSIIQILSNFQVIGTMIGYTLGLVFYNTISSLMKDVIKPLLGKILHTDLSKISVNIIGVKLILGNLIGNLIDLILILFTILFLLRFILKDLVQSIIQKKSEQNDLLKQLVNETNPYNVSSTL